MIKKYLAFIAATAAFILIIHFIIRYNINNINPDKINYAKANTIKYMSDSLGLVVSSLDFEVSEMSTSLQQDNQEITFQFSAKNNLNEKSCSGYYKSNFESGRFISGKFYLASNCGEKTSNH
jgi:hypothetical protein